MQASSWTHDTARVGKEQARNVVTRSSRESRKLSSAVQLALISQGPIGGARRLVTDEDDDRHLDWSDLPA